MRFVARGLAFFALMVLLYAGFSAVLALVQIDGKPLFEGLTRLILRPVEGGNTQERMAEFDHLVAEERPLDALFLGSSLTYRGIDARHFAARGHRVFALGLSAQTPLNYEVLLRNLPRPADSLTVVFEASPPLLSTDGTEAFFTFAVNRPLGKTSVEMALNVRSPRALNLLAALAWYRAAHPLGSEPPVPDVSGDRYIGAGFTERSGALTADSLHAYLSHLPTHQPLRQRQLAALARSIELVQTSGKTRAALVAPPIHPAHRRARPVLDAQADTLRTLAVRHRVPYIDLSALPLDALADFSDLTHLSPRGVARYNAALTDSLAVRGLL